MRLIIEPDYDRMSKWAANYVAKCINEAKPTADKPFKLGCPTGSSPLGMYKELIALNKAGKVSFQNVIMTRTCPLSFFLNKKFVWRRGS